MPNRPSCFLRTTSRRSTKIGSTGLASVGTGAATATAARRSVSTAASFMALYSENIYVNKNGGKLVSRKEERRLSLVGPTSPPHPFAVICCFLLLRLCGTAVQPCPSRKVHGRAGRRITQHIK
ncbi:hypothetical protein GQ54DRAFT_126398 [Martensiomyces pterosporus]|nr:hypothetical protein GQ54DRAFT_126398 [Martensiomyces pterosporus]